MAELKRQRLFPAGLILAALALLLYKSVSLALDISGSALPAWRFVLLDLDFVAVLMGLGLAQARTRTRLGRNLLRALLLLVVLFYAIHSFVLLELDENMSLFDLARYVPEWGVVRSFFGPLTVVVVVGLLLAIGLDWRLSRRQHLVGAAVAVTFLAAGLAFTNTAPANIRKYSLIQAGRLAEPWLRAQPTSTYTPAQRRFYATAEPDPVEFTSPDPDLVLLIVESLSSINSQRTSGELDLLPGFDQLSRQGVLFTNFFANHSASEGGIISLLGGFPPLHYPTASPLMFDEFARQASVLGSYRRHGYVTEFLTNADLGFIGLDRYLEGLGLDLARGRDEVPTFAGADRFVQDAPSDRYLYREALERVKARMADKEPWILVIATVSTHLPYTHPEGGEDTARAVWDWSMQRLLEFHQGLEALGFYDDGLLLVTGDHRQMRPLTRVELRRYGDSAKARIPLLVLGDHVRPGRIDQRWFQQADLLRYLPRIVKPGLPLSPMPIWVERYNRIYGKVESINRFSVFNASNDGREEFPVKVLGTEISWTGARPNGYRAVEARVHAQRSAHQFVRNGAGLGCGAGLADLPPPRQDTTGLWRSVEGAAEALRAEPESMPDSGVELASGLEPGPAMPGSAANAALRFQGYLQVPEAGTYWFRAAEGTSLCLGIGNSLLIDQVAGQARMQAPVDLQVGMHAFDLRYFPARSTQAPGLEWVIPGTLRWHWRVVPEAAYHPDGREPGQAGNDGH